MRVRACALSVRVCVRKNYDLRTRPESLLYWPRRFAPPPPQDEVKNFTAASFRRSASAAAPEFLAPAQHSGHLTITVLTDRRRRRLKEKEPKRKRTTRKGNGWRKPDVPRPRQQDVAVVVVRARVRLYITYVLYIIADMWITLWKTCGKPVENLWKTCGKVLTTSLLCCIMKVKKCRSSNKTRQKGFTMSRGRKLSRRKSIKSWRHAVNKGARRRIKMMRGGIRL